MRVASMVQADQSMVQVTITRHGGGRFRKSRTAEVDVYADQICVGTPESLR